MISGMIVAVLIIVLLGLAKRGRGRRRSMGRYLKGIVDEKLQLTTLASRTLVAVAFDETVNERTYVSSLVVSCALDSMTEGASIGPIQVGVAHSDYSAAEIEEWIENTGSWNEGDLVQSREVAKRLIRSFGIFPSSGESLGTSALWEGKQRRVKLGWILNQGQTLDLWAYNLGTQAIATTVPNVNLQGHANLWPK